MKMKSVFVSGYTQAPKGTTLFESAHTLGVMLEIDRESHKIISAECTFITKLAQEYFSKLLVGFNFAEDIDEIIGTIKDNLIIPSANSIIVAVNVANQRYMDSLVKNK